MIGKAMHLETEPLTGYVRINPVHINQDMDTYSKRLLKPKELTSGIL